MGRNGAPGDLLGSADEHPLHESAIAPEVAPDYGLRQGIRTNQIAQRIWDLLGENKTITEIAALITSEYGLDSHTALDATGEIISCFQAKKAIVTSKRK